MYAGKVNVPEYMVRDGVTYRILTDHLGSVRLVVNASTGETVHRRNYDEFGAVLFDSSPGFIPFGFAGGLYDHETGLVRFGARDYDAAVGRWTAKDPIGFAGGDGNLYGYCGNSPVEFLDLDGEFAWVAGAAVVGGIATAVQFADAYHTGAITGGDYAQIVAIGAIFGAANFVLPGLGSVISGAATGVFMELMHQDIMGKDGCGGYDTGTIFGAGLTGAAGGFLQGFGRAIGSGITWTTQTVTPTLMVFATQTAVQGGGMVGSAAASAWGVGRSVRER